MARADPVPFAHEALKQIDRRAITCALGVWLTVVAALALQIDDPWWGAIAAYRVSVRSQTQSEYLRRNRLFGTLAGCALGFILAGLILDNNVLALFATFVLAVVGTYRRFTAAAAYGWLLGAITAMLVINFAIFEPDDAFRLTVDRMMETVLAVTILGIIDRSFMPRTPGHQTTPVPVLTEAERHEYAVVALAAGVTVVLLALIWLRLDLPQPLAVFVTTLAVYNTTVSAQKAKSFQRFSGVILGGAIGLGVAALSIESFWLWSAVFLVFIAAFSAYANSDRPDSYVGLQAGYGFLVATVTGSGPIESILPVLNRIIGVSFGVVVAYVVLMSLHAVLRKGPS